MFATTMQIAPNRISQIIGAAEAAARVIREEMHPQ